ncbi:cell division protein PerM [Trueperella pecoris]|uniref:Uncharacterized protein n=1 Tax=Trueperella pecoris TaxID=2733571 RepID=A0A7M1QSK3_9ACTO|nr:DUF6350 family protein [Trueperella pecoris]QOR45060.1 hypothetical protein INS88_07150 [Trueperella pecoris]
MKTIDLSRELVVARGAIAPPFFTWLAMVVYAIVFYTLTASAPMLGEITWRDASRVGTGWWMTAFGSSTQIGGVTVSLMPTLITLIALYASYVIFRRRGVVTWAEVAAATIAQALVVAVIGAVVRPDGVWWAAIAGAGAAGFASSLAAAREELINLPYLDRALPRLRLMAGALGGLALAVGLLALVMGWSRMIQIHGFYLAGAVGSVGLVLLQLMYLPTALMWALAWLLGPGFAVGVGTNYSVLGVESAPLPAIPLLGALPSVSAGYPWLLGVVAVIFFGLGMYATKREESTLGGGLLSDTVASVAIAFAVSIGCAMSAGALGPERLATVGPYPALVFAAVLILVGLPSVLGTLAMHPATRAYLSGKRGDHRTERTSSETPESPSDWGLGEEAPTTPSGVVSTSETDGVPFVDTEEEREQPSIG